MKTILSLIMFLSLNHAHAVAYSETLCELKNFTVKNEKVELVMRSEYARNYAEMFPIEFFFRTIDSRNEIERLVYPAFTNVNPCASKDKCTAEIATIAGKALIGDFFAKDSLIEVTTLANSNGRLNRVEITGRDVFTVIHADCGLPALYP